jgi:hypothetical protein
MTEEIPIGQNLLREAAGVLFDRQSYYTADRPHDYGPGRRCTMPLSRCKTAERCGEVGKINRYVHPQAEAQGDTPEILLCSLCNADRIKRFASPEQYQYGWGDGFKRER